MTYGLRFSLFLFAACVVASALGYISAYVAPWVSVLMVLVTIPLAIEMGGRC